MRDSRVENQIVSELLPDKIWNKMFISIFFTSMALNLAQQMSNSLLAKYADSLGAPASLIGILMSMFAISAMVFKIVSGPAMDTFNRKFLLMGAMVVYAVAYFGFSFSSSVETLMVFRLLQGCGNAFGNVCCLALVAGALPKDKYGTGMGYFALAQTVSQAIGPAIGLQLVAWFGFNVTYMINGGVMLLAAFVASRVKLDFKRTRKFQISFHNIIAKEALLPASLILLLSMGFMVGTSFLVLSASQNGITANVGLYFTVNALTLLATRPLVGKLTDRFGLVKIAVPAIFLTAVSYFIISGATTLPMLLVAAVVGACGYGACQPSIQSLTMKAVSKERRGAGGSTNYLGQDFGTLLGPTIAGFFAQAFGYAAMWRFMTIPFALAMVVVVVFRKKIYQIETDFEATQGNQTVNVGSEPARV